MIYKKHYRFFSLNNILTKEVSSIKIYQIKDDFLIIKLMLTYFCFGKRLRSKKDYDQN